jgi:putative Ca2+/H+ antiporter (TMEM165/GDT1 family)
MDFKIVATTFLSVFLAELGDKTQLMTLVIAGTGSSKLSVWVGAALALLATTTIAVALGEIASRVVPVVWMHRAAGTLFILLGLYYLWTAGAKPA